MKVRGASFFVFTIIASVGYAADSPYPFRAGSTWTYRVQDGPTKSAMVEGLVTVETSLGKAQGAVVRRTDRRDRVVFRSEHQWLECTGLPKRGEPYRCESPLIFFQWPIEAGTKWTTQDYQFRVTASEPVEVPAGKFSRAWKMSYAPTGSNDPVGEVWIAEGVGVVKIEEGPSVELLHSFASGSGKELAVTPDAVFDSFLESPTPVTSEPSRTSKRLLPTIPYPLVMMVIIPLFLLGLGMTFGIWFLRELSRKGVEGMLPQSADISEQARVAMTMADAGQIQEAVGEMERLVDDRPMYADLRHKLATLLKAEGDLQRAVKQWKEALRINPEYTDARLGLASLLLSAGEPDQAKTHYGHVVRRHPTYADAQMGLGRCCLMLGEFETAGAAFEAALAINPRIAEAQQLLVECRKMTHPTQESADA